MKRFLCLLLCLFLLPGALPARAEEPPAVLSAQPVYGIPEALPAPQYVGKLRLSAKVFSKVRGEDGLEEIDILPAKVYVKVLAIDPTFALISFEERELVGYIKRLCLEEVRTLNPETTPPYGVEFNHFIATVAAEDAPVTAAPGDGETFITLHKGARVSLIGFENGYGKLVYHREYGYIDSRLLTEPVPVYPTAEEAGTDAPIAAFTSFYKIITTEANINRMANIALACRKLGEKPLPPGARFSFNEDVGPYRASTGFLPAPVLVKGETKPGYGGGTCQVSSTLYNVLLQLPGVTVLQRRAHGNNGAPYLPIGVDAAVGNKALNLRFRNDYPFPIHIDAYSQDGALTIAVYKAEE